MKAKIYYQFNGIWFGKVYLVKSKYANGRTAIQLMHDEEGPIAIATVNIPDAELAADEVIIKDYSENEGMAEFIEENNIGKPTGRFVKSGYVTCPVFKLTEGII